MQYKSQKYNVNQSTWWWREFFFHCAVISIHSFFPLFLINFSRHCSKDTDRDRTSTVRVIIIDGKSTPNYTRFHRVIKILWQLIQSQRYLVGWEFYHHKTSKQASAKNIRTYKLIHHQLKSGGASRGGIIRRGSIRVSLWLWHPLYLPWMSIRNDF